MYLERDPDTHVHGAVAASITWQRMNEAGTWLIQQVPAMTSSLDHVMSVDADVHLGRGLVESAAMHRACSKLWSDRFGPSKSLTQSITDPSIHPFIHSFNSLQMPMGRGDELDDDCCPFNSDTDLLLQQTTSVLWWLSGAVASLGLVLSPVAATEGVTPIFPEENWRPFLVIAVCKVMTFFSCPTSFVHCSF